VNPACFVVHGKRHLLAALAAGAASGRPVIALSGESAGAYAGAEWFLALVRQCQPAFPDVELTAMFDCGDRAGDALAALKAGVGDVVFTGHPDAAVRLAAISGQRGARIHDARPPAFDLIGLRNPAKAALRWATEERT
jgi:hypothetical protein